MTPDELRKLADEATGGHPIALENLRALASDLARLCAELGEALWLVHECGDALVGEGFSYLTEPARAALAKLSELETPQ